MTKIVLLRVDDRLVHGQVVTKWVQQSGAKKIIIVDDMLAANTYLSNVYKMAAPQGIEVTTMSTKDFIDSLNENKFRDQPIMLLFKSIANLKQAFDLGFKTEKVQIGGIGASAGKKLVYHTVAMNDEDAKQLQEIANQGVEIYFQRVPDDRIQSLAAIIQKYF